MKFTVVEQDVRDDQVSHVDIASTIANSYRVDLPDSDGSPLPDDGADRKVISFGTDRPYLDISSKPFAALRLPGRKVIYNHSKEDEFYLLDESPEECNNLVSDRLTEYDQLLSELIEHVHLSEMAKSPENHTYEDESEEVKQRLDDLGYLD